MLKFIEEEQLNSYLELRSNLKRIEDGTSILHFWKGIVKVGNLLKNRYNPESSTTTVRIRNYLLLNSFCVFFS